MIRKMNSFTRICQNAYPFLESCIPILNYMPNTHSLHNKYRIKVEQNKSQSTFDGKNNCGGVSYLLDYFLKMHNYENTLTKTTVGNFTSKRTHTYLVNGYYIIDPTYRQMFTPDYSETENIKGDDEYHTYLFKHLPYTFIGTFDDFVSLYNTLNTLHKLVYKQELTNKLYMWQDGVDISTKSDFDKVVDSLSYAQLKGAPYIKLHTMLYHSKDKYFG